ncbi:MAG TPA: hypothetical protein VFM94_07705 [Solirubrobacterales bacterium]|nr:hypothetical protein [Solirubrobacterales bacterium]
MPVMLERWKDDKMDALEAKVDGLGRRVGNLERRMERGFERVDEKFERVDDRLYGLQKETKEGFEAVHRTMNRNVLAICGVFIAALIAWPG